MSFHLRPCVRVMERRLSYPYPAALRRSAHQRKTIMKANIRPKRFHHSRTVSL